MVFILIYVDDIIVTDTSTQHINFLIDKLVEKFHLKDIGTLKFFLIMELKAFEATDSMILSQRRYINDLLLSTNMDSSTPELTPMVSSSKLSITDGNPLAIKFQYKSIVGALQYLVHTRLDIRFTIIKLCQFLQNPTTTHWGAVKRVLRYIRGHQIMGLFSFLKEQQV